jgi:hypothetical protein
MLQKAGNDAGISDLEKWLQSTRDKVMFVDPRLVRIKHNCYPATMEILYDAPPEPIREETDVSGTDSDSGSTMDEVAYNAMPTATVM